MDSVFYFFQVARIRCDKCVKTFSRKDNYQAHQKVAHEGKKEQWSCHLCVDKWFSKIPNLRKHAKKHHPRRNVEKIIQNAVYDVKDKIRAGCVACFLCNKSFASETNRKLHIKAYHSNIKSPDKISVKINERSVDVEKNDEYVSRSMSISSSSAASLPVTSNNAAQIWDAFVMGNKAQSLITPKYIPIFVRASYTFTSDNEYFGHDEPSSPITPDNQCESIVTNLLDNERFEDVEPLPLTAPDNQVNCNKSNITDDAHTNISNNIYIDSAKEAILPNCNCVECGDDCIDRIMKMECSPKTCNCDSDKCKNMKMSKNSIVKVERFKTDEKGWGVRAKEFIPKETFIMEYVGEVMKEMSFKEQLATRYHKYQHNYSAKLSDGLVINSYEKGNISRFVNHSCSPNCKLEKWIVDEHSRLAIYSQKDIQEGEELCYDYDFQLFNPQENQICKCNSDNCRGFISSKRVQSKKKSLANSTKENCGNMKQLKPTNKANSKKPEAKLRFKLPFPKPKLSKRLSGAIPVKNSPQELKSQLACTSRVTTARKNGQSQLETQILNNEQLNRLQMSSQNSRTDGESLSDIEEYMNTVFSGKIPIRNLNMKKNAVETTQKEPVESLIDMLSDKHEKNSASQKATRSKKMTSGGIADCSEENDNGESERKRYKMMYIDENDKSRFKCIRENKVSIQQKATATATKPVQIGINETIVRSGNLQVKLEPSDLMELYDQDIESVVKERMSLKKSKDI